MSGFQFMAKILSVATSLKKTRDTFNMLKLL